MTAIPPESPLWFLVGPVVRKWRLYDSNPVVTVLRIVATFPLAPWEVSTNHLPVMGGRFAIYLFETPSLQPSALLSFNPSNNNRNRDQPGKDFTHVLAVAVLTASFGVQPFNDDSIRLAVSVVASCVSALSCAATDGTVIISNSLLRSTCYTLAVLTISSLFSTDLFGGLEILGQEMSSFLLNLDKFFIYTRKHNISDGMKSSFAEEARNILASSTMPKIKLNIGAINPIPVGLGTFATNAKPSSSEPSPSLHNSRINSGRGSSDESNEDREKQSSKKTPLRGIGIQSNPLHLKTPLKYTATNVWMRLHRMILH